MRRPIMAVKHKDYQVMNCSESAHKATYSSRREAAAAAAVAKQRYGTKLRPYRCKSCDLWHLASA